MATIIPPGWGLVSHYHQLTGGSMPSGPSVVTYGIHFAGTDPQEACDTAAAYWGSVVEGVCASGYESLLTTLKVGPNSTGATYETATDVQGTNGAEPVMPQVAVLVKKLTGIGGRSQRGRLYMPGFNAAEAFVDGSIGTTSVSDMQVVFDTFLAGLATEGIPMALLHSQSSDPTEVTSLVVQSKVATQRRRMR